MASNTKIVKEYTEDCVCRRCSTYATIIEYECGCVKVKIYNDKAPCAGCTNFSAMRYTASGCR